MKSILFLTFTLILSGAACKKEEVSSSTNAPENGRLTGKISYANGNALPGAKVIAEHTVWFGTSAGQIYKSTDFGSTWTVNTLSAAQETVYEIAFNDDGLHGLSHVRNNTSTKLFATSDGGTTWTQIPTNTIPFWKQSRICSVPGTNTFVSTSVNGGVNRGSSYTTNNGVTWTLIEATKQKAACRFLNSTTGWSGGFFNDNPLYAIGDGIFKWDNTVSLNTNENSLDALDVVVYPNPSNGKITLLLSEEYTSEIKIEIIDLVGRVTKNLNYSTLISNEINVDLSNLEKGNYLIRIESGGKISTKKISLIN